MSNGSLLSAAEMALERLKNFLLRDFDNVDDEAAALREELSNLGIESTISKRTIQTLLTKASVKSTSDALETMQFDEQDAISADHFIDRLMGTATTSAVAVAPTPDDPTSAPGPDPSVPPLSPVSDLTPALTSAPTSARQAPVQSATDHDLIESLTAQLDAANERNLELQAHLDQFKLILGHGERMGQLKRQNEDLVKMVSALEMKVEENRSAKQKIFQELEAAHNEIESLKLLSASKGGSDTTIIELESLLDEFQEKSKAQLKEIATLKYQNTKQLATVQTIQSEFEALRAKVRYKVRDPALEEDVFILTKENGKLRTQVSMLQADVAYYEAKMTAHTQAVKTFKAEFMAETEKQILILQDLLDFRVKKYEKVIGEKDDVIAEQRKEIESLREALKNNQPAEPTTTTKEKSKPQQPASSAEDPSTKQAKSKAEENELVAPEEAAAVPPNDEAARAYKVPFDPEALEIPSVIADRPADNYRAADVIKNALGNIDQIVAFVEDVAQKESAAQQQQEQQKDEEKEEEEEEDDPLSEALDNIISSTTELLQSVHTFTQVALDPPLAGSAKEAFTQAVRVAFKEFKVLQESCRETGVEEFEEPVNAISLELASLIKMLRATLDREVSQELEQEANEKTHRIAVTINELQCVVEEAKNNH